MPLELALGTALNFFVFLEERGRSENISSQWHLSLVPFEPLLKTLPLECALLSIATYLLVKVEED